MINRLLVDIHADYKKNLSGEYRYGGNHADYISVTDLETTDANYLNSNYHRIGASLTYSQLAKKGVKTHFFKGNKCLVKFSLRSLIGRNEPAIMCNTIMIKHQIISVYHKIKLI